ncbi:hypothetical protein K438DRAFT_1979958 [Mycena galopus ATCC 62051]|nr:hypothetical protein K438DRAFT_1979958 [Mycena galopus ATCC 62051]
MRKARTHRTARSAVAEEIRNGGTTNKTSSKRPNQEDEHHLRASSEDVPTLEKQYLKLLGQWNHNECEHHQANSPPPNASIQSSHYGPRSVNERLDEKKPRGTCAPAARKSKAFRQLNVKRRGRAAVAASTQDANCLLPQSAKRPSYPISRISSHTPLLAPSPKSNLYQSSNLSERTP